MTRKLFSITLWLALIAFAVPASAALITVIHGLPALPGAVPSSNPVDVAIDGKCEYIYQPYGAKMGPRQTKAGELSIIFYESIPDNPCQGTVLAARQGFLSDSDQIDVTIGLNAQDQVSVITFDNTPALDAIDNGFETAVEFRNVAAGPTLGVVLKKGNEAVGSAAVQPGLTTGPYATTAGEHTLRVQNGPEVLEQDNDTLKDDRAYWVYITGSVFKKTVNLLSIESIPGELIEGGEPPPAAFSTCCAFGVAIQVSQNQCTELGGNYLGDVDPSKNPCQGTPFFSFGAQSLNEAPDRETLLEQYTGF